MDYDKKAQGNQGKQGWYARMSDDKKAEYLEKRHQARADKKAATLIAAKCQQLYQDHPSILSPERTPFSNITNTHKYGTFLTSGTLLLHCFMEDVIMIVLFPSIFFAMYSEYTYKLWEYCSSTCR